MIKIYLTPYTLSDVPLTRLGPEPKNEDYEGGRELSELQKFAKDNLGPRP